MHTRWITAAFAVLASCGQEASAPPPAPAANERRAPEVSLTNVFAQPPQPERAPPIEIVPHPDGQLVTVREYHTSGWLYTERVERVAADGARVRHGPLKAWHENRQLMQVGEYLDGQISGHWTYWTDVGVREREGDYEFGMRSGDWLAWHSNGQLRAKTFFHANLAEGPGKLWHDNGQLEGEGEYIANKREGPWRFWLPDGAVDVERTGTYADNRRVR